MYGDYELVLTKRVKRNRFYTNVYMQRRFEAEGGYNTLFFTALFGYCGHKLARVSESAVALPNAMPMSAPYMKVFARNAAVLAGPTFVGFMLGRIAFGNREERKNLSRFGSVYRNEFNEMRNEAFYE